MRFILASSLSGFFVASVVSTASAQAPIQRTSPPSPAEALDLTEQDRHPTMFEPQKQSLEGLLNNGWSIVAAGGGPLVVLSNSNQKWILCTIHDGRLLKTRPSSECLALN